MKAAVLHRQGRAEEDPLSLEEVPRPQPQPGQILLRVEACGVCHTDLHLVEGDLPARRLPLVPGHQIVGRLEALGEGATAPAVGERVGLPWLQWTCGACEPCRAGLENLCPQARFTGWDADGGFAQYAVAPADFVHPLPPDVRATELAPLLCAGVVGYRALRLCGVRPGQTLGLYGFGASAHLIIQVARHWGCVVYVFSRSEHHREQARELGAAWAGGAQQQPPEPLHAGIVFAPAGWIVPLALRVLRPGGTLALAGIHMSPIPEMDYQLLYGERVLRSVANLTRQDAGEFLSLAAEIPVRARVEVYPLERANEALLRLKRAEVRGAAVLEVAPG